jgi:hypothetical protein
MAFPAENTPVRKYDIRVDGMIRYGQTNDQIADLFSRGLVKRDTPCKLSETGEWHDVNEFFPTLKHIPVGAPIRIRDSPDRPSRDLATSFDSDERSKPALTSALKAGWICFALGMAVAWIFPPAYLFFSVALILAIVAMCTHQVNKGVILLLSSFVGMGTSALVSLFLAVGLFAHAVEPAVAKAQADLDRHRQQQRGIEGQLHTTQQQAIPAVNRAFKPEAQNTPATVVRPSVESLNQRQLLDEVARIEKQQRELRRSGRDLPESTREYLEKLRAAF